MRRKPADASPARLHVPRGPRADRSLRQSVRLRVLLGSLLCSLAAPAARCGEAPDMAAIRAGWNRPAAPLHVIGPVYDVGSEELGIWLIHTPKGEILLDGGLEETVPLIERNLATLGFSVRNVRYLINSHAHFDHSGGLARLKRDSGATLVASAGDRGSLESGSYLGFESDHRFDAPPVQVDRVIADGETLSLGGVTLTAHVTPGHTRGCTTWTMPVTEASVRHQVIFYCSTTVAANRLYPDPQYPGIVEDYRRSFARLADLRADVFLSNHKDFFDLPGKRARLTAGGPNPFVDAGELARFVAGSRREFEQALAAQQAAALATAP